MNDLKIFDLRDFELATQKNYIGKGSNGIVHHLQYKKTQEFFAVKFLDSNIPNFEKLFLREINILSKLEYPTLVQQYGIISEPPAFVSEFVPNQTIQYYINEAFQGKSHQGWDINNKINIILGISFGMKHLHSKGIIHRDLKPDNVLLDTNFYPKI